MRRVTLFFAMVLLVSATIPAQENPKQPVRIDWPRNDIGVASLAGWKEAQMKTADQITAFHGFRFTDNITESGITFRHQIVDDAGKFYKAVHYDHGNGIAVADVDGDELYDIYFVSQLGGNELWKNLGGGKFKNVTDKAGVGLRDRVGVTASFADIDNDGDQDLFVTTVRKGNVLLENNGNGVFKDISKQAGLDYSGHSSGAVFFDYDNDGLLDLFLANVGDYTTDETGRGGYYVGYTDGFTGHTKPERTEYSILYRNLDKNRFENVSDRTNLKGGGWSGDAAFHDVNRDGYPDLYVLNMQGDDHYYENIEGLRFVDKTAETFPKTPWGSMGVKFFDYNNDGLFDLLLTDMHSDMSHEVGPEHETMKSDMQWSDEVLQGRDNNIFGNAFFKNAGKGKFEETSDALGLENYWPWGVSVEDLNADGFEDVFITASMNFPFRYGINSTLLNQQGGKFAAAEFILGVEPRKDGNTKTHWFDLDCAGADQGHPMCGKQATFFAVYGSLGSRSAVIFDLDNDGDMDIVTNEFGSEPQVLISDLASQTKIHYVKINLRGKLTNRNGLGSFVKVTAGGKTYSRYLDGKSGYLSQSALPLYVGLGDANKVDRIEVQWPSGRKQIVQQAAINTTVNITEPRQLNVDED